MTSHSLPPARPILFTVCAGHTPQAELDAINWKYPGQVTHILCPDCALKFEQLA